MKEMFLFAGPNGSGKSTVVNDFIEQKICPSYYICPDNNIDKRLKDDVNAYIEAMKRAETQRYNAISERKSFSFESVFSTREKLDFLKYVKSKNYIITVIYVTTRDPQINIKRICERVSKGGHSVPNDKVISRYYKSMSLISECLSIVDNFFLYDNSNEKPVLVFRRNKFEEYVNHDYINVDWITRYLKNS